MTIQHHPLDELLTAFAAGTLDLGQHVAVATHLIRCSHCRDVMHLMEHVGGAVLAGLSPTPMSSDAFARIETRLREPVAHEPRSERHGDEHGHAPIRPRHRVPDLHRHDADAAAV